MSIKFVPPFLLIRKDCQVYLYDDLTSLAVAMKGHIHKIFEHHVLSQQTNIYGYALYDSAGNPLQEIAEWIVRDDHGQIVKQSVIKAALPVKTFRFGSRYLITDQAIRAIELGIAIPHTGARFYGSYMRSPKGMGARAAKASNYEKDFEDVIPKGKIKLPPDPWDDIIRADYGRRNWKHYRKHQWKG